MASGLHVDALRLPTGIDIKRAVFAFWVGYAAAELAETAPDAAITLAFCWAHLRRRFFDVVQAGPAPIASEALERIAALYAIEKTISGRSADQRRAGHE